MVQVLLEFHNKKIEHLISIDDINRLIFISDIKFKLQGFRRTTGILFILLKGHPIQRRLNV